MRVVVDQTTEAGSVRRRFGEVDTPSQDAWFRQVYAECAPQLLARLTRGFGYTVRGGEHRYLVLKSAFEREEVVQETFCRFLAQRRRGTFDEGRDPAPYIYRIGYNTALRYAGKLSREIPDEDVTLDDGDSVSSEPDASEEVIRKEKVAQVRSALTTLGEKDLDVFRLTFDEDLSQSKVAERLGLSRDQVYRSLCSIRKLVAAHVRKLGWLD